MCDELQNHNKENWNDAYNNMQLTKHNTNGDVDPELLIRIGMSSKSDASMIIGISMDQELCLIIGQVSLSLLCWKSNFQTDICSPGRD